MVISNQTGPECDHVDGLEGLHYYQSSRCGHPINNDKRKRKRKDGIAVVKEGLRELR